MSCQHHGDGPEGRVCYPCTISIAGKENMVHVADCSAQAAHPVACTAERSGLVLVPLNALHVKADSNAYTYCATS